VFWPRRKSAHAQLGRAWMQAATVVGVAPVSGADWLFAQSDS
jgi:hypothetical protein